MRRPYPLLLKKRGRRSTGSPIWARVGEGFYHALFVAAGLIGLWWLFADVLIPEWRLASEARGFEESECLIVDKRVAARPGLADPEYCVELQVEFDPSGAMPIRVWTRHGVGRDTPSYEEAQAALPRFELGVRRPCWFDPSDPHRVLLSVRQRWWPWIIVAIPLSLLVVGLVGVVRTVAASGATAERRSALAMRGIDLGQLDPERPRPTIASGLPPVYDADDSPGVHQAYRLPGDSSQGWRVAGLATLCGVWNLLVALFAFQIGAGYLSSATRLALTAAITAPLVAIGVRLTLAVWRDARGAGAVGSTRVEVDQRPLVVGESAQLTVLQFGQARIRTLDVDLVCEEVAMYRQGTDTRSAIAEVARTRLRSERHLALTPDAPLSLDAKIDVPFDAPHSFVSPNNEVRWLVEVTISPAMGAATRRRFPLAVYPRTLLAPAKNAVRLEGVRA